MNSSFLFLGIFIATIHSVVSMFPQEVLEACKKETGFEGKVMELDFNDSSFPKEGKCFLACTMQKMKLIKEDGTFDKEAAISQLTKSFKDEQKKNEFIKTVNECNEEVKVQPDPCDTAFEYVKCKKSKMPED